MKYSIVGILILLLWLTLLQFQLINLEVSVRATQSDITQLAKATDKNVDSINYLTNAINYHTKAIKILGGAR